MKNYVILLASGTGSRFGGDIPKQFVEINGRMVVEYTIDVCMRTVGIDEVVVVVPKEYCKFMQDVVDRNKYVKLVRVVAGGASRKESCSLGLAAIPDDHAKVLIHNAVQPFVSTKTFEDCIRALDDFRAVSVGSPSVYTVLELDDNRILKRIVPRSHSVNDLGPECFEASFLRKIFSTVGNDDSFTNITGIVAKYGMADVYVVDGDPSNIKITYADDVLLAKKILEERERHRL